MLGQVEGPYLLRMEPILDQLAPRRPLEDPPRVRSGTFTLLLGPALGERSPVPPVRRPSQHGRPLAAPQLEVVHDQRQRREALERVVLPSGVGEVPPDRLWTVGVVVDVL